MTEGLDHPDYRVRMRTIHLLVEQGHAEAVPLLRPLLHDREMPVRCAAIVALGTFADRQAFDPLVACLASPISLERENAVQALVALGDPRRRDAFLDALKTEINPSIRVGFVKALSVFPDEEVPETLIERLTDRDEDVRAVTAIALGNMGQPRALPALQQMALTDTTPSPLLGDMSSYDNVLDAAQGGQFELQLAKTFLKAEEFSQVLPSHMRLWDEGDYTTSEFVRIAVGQPTLDKDPDDEFDQREKNENELLPDRILYEEWDRNPAIGFSTFVSAKGGLLRE